VSTQNEEGFREIQLNGKQLVFLFMAATVVSVVIFLCGVMVGRGARPERVAAEEVAAAEIAADPGTATPAAAQPAAPVTEPPAPADELTYAERLQKDTPPKETLKPAAPPAQMPAPPSVMAEPSPAVRPATPPESGKTATNRTLQTVTAQNTGISASDPKGPGFAVQVAALDDRQSADTLARQLVAKGYPAFVMDPVKGAPVSKYRVRVGKYKSRKDAEAISTRLETVEQFKPWIAR
jgi:DedD protein